MRGRGVLLPLLLVPVLWVDHAQGRGSPNTWIEATTTNPHSCTLAVVLVTFKDTSASGNSQLDYHQHDLPYGTNEGQSAGDRYKLSDFLRLFNGGYDDNGDTDATTAFVGTSVTVADGDTIPEVFGSVRTYFDSMSTDRAAGDTEGKFQVHARVINAADGDYLRWIQLPRIKEYYHEIDSKDSKLGDAFWDDAYAAARDSVSCWRSGTRASDKAACGSISGYAIKPEDLPNDSFSKDRRIRHKVAYLYSGAVYKAKDKRLNNNDRPGLLHPQADKITEPNPTKPGHVGYRYLTAERTGGGTSNHGNDGYGSIATHVHEIGHLLGLRHGQGRWEGVNPHSPRSTRLDTNLAGANFLDWAIMQDSKGGPASSADDYFVGYGSCPAPLNPFYRKDLGWIQPVEITASKQDYPLDAGSVHMIAAGKWRTLWAQQDTFLLERRSNHGFGRYVSFFEFADQDPGLLIWRRDNSEWPVLIVADDRRIRDAREKEQNPTVHEYQDQLSDPFPVPENVYTGHGQHDSYAQPAVNAVYAHIDTTGLRQKTWGTGGEEDPGNLGLALTDIRRRSETGNDSLTLDVQLNYWAGSIGPDMEEVWGDGLPGWDTDTVHVGGDVTIPAGSSLTIEPGTVVKLTGDSDLMSAGNDPGKSEILVYGDLFAEGVTFQPADGRKWGGLVMYGDTLAAHTSSVLRGCRIDSASAGVRVRTVGWTLGGEYLGEGNTFSSCDTAIVVAGESGFDPSGNAIRQNHVTGSGVGIDLRMASGTSIQHNLITGSTAYGIGVNGGASTRTEILNTTLQSDAGRGISFTGGASGTVGNTIASGFPDGGVVEAGTDSLVTVDYYLGHDTGADDLSGTRAGTRRALFSDPKFTDPENGDFTLRSRSPALDLGPEESGLPPEDGSRIDLGRYGGTSRAGTASRLALEDYFHGGDASGWTEASGTWEGDAWSGTYRVTNTQGPAKAHRWIDAARYTVETRLRGQEGKVFYQHADRSGDFAVHLSASGDSVRLSRRDSSGAAAVSSVEYELAPDAWYAVRVEVAGDSVSVSVDDSLLYDLVSSGAPADGAVGVGSSGGVQSTPKPEFDYVLVLDATPGTPDSLISIPLNGRVELCWDDPGDETITGYAYRDSLDGGADWSDWKEISGGGGALSYTVPSLSNDTLYTFQVRAVNAAGFGLAAQVSATPSDTLDSNTAPWFAEESVVRTVVENSPAPTPVGAPVTALDKNQDDTLRYSLTGSGLFDIEWRSGQIAVSSQATQETLNHEADSLHTVWVTVSDGLDSQGAEDPAVDDSIAVEIRVTDEEGEEPGKPEVTLSVPSTDGHEELEVSWSAVNYGPPVDSSRVQYCKDTDCTGGMQYDMQHAWTISTIQDTATSTTLTGLASNAKYTVRVKSYNAEGVGVWSDTASETTDGKPLTVSFSASSYSANEAGSAVSVPVKLSAKSDRDLKIPVAVTAGPGTEEEDYTVTGLTQDTLSYAPGDSVQSFTVAANQDPDGEDETVSLAFGAMPSKVTAGAVPSATVNLVDLLGVPDAPGNLAADPGDTEVALTWETPDNNGSVIAEYAHRDSAAGGSWSAWVVISDSDSSTTAYTDTGLTNDTSYTFQVRAGNSVGWGTGSNLASATPVAPPCNLSLSGSTAVSFAENGTGSVGTYTATSSNCGSIAWSRAGSDSSAFQLQGTGLSRTLRFNSAPDFEAKSSYAVTVTVSSGQTSASRQVAVTITDVNEPPDTPANVRAAANGHTELTVTWRAADTSGRPGVSGYEAGHRLSGSSGWGSTSVSGTDTSTDITGLQSNSSYEVRVRAANNEGTSGWSDTVAGQTAVKPLTVFYGASTYQAREAAGSVPVRVALSSASDRELKIPISVTRPSGTETGDYTVSGWDQDGKVTVAKDSSGATFAIAANQDEDADDETVTLGFGSSLPSRVSAGTPATAAVTLKDSLAVPPKPTAGLGATAGTGEIAVEWDEVSAVPAVSGYVLKYQEKTSGSWGSLSSLANPGAGDSTYAHSGLTWSTSYRYRLRARNSLGDGAWSDYIPGAGGIQPKPPCPSQPGGFQAAAGDSAATLSWSDPSDASITGYQYRKSTDNGQTWSPNWTGMSGTSATTTSRTLSDLNNGSRYTFQVRAVNDCGAGPGSSQAAVVLPLRVPGDYSTINGAISAASSGVPVLISAGTYFESVNMKSGVSLRKHGSGTVTVTPPTGAPWSNAANFSGDNGITVDGLRFKGASGDGVYVSNSSNVTLKNCDFLTSSRTTNDALYVGGSASSVTLQNCTLHKAKYGLNSNGAGAVNNNGGSSDFYDNGTYGVYVTNNGNAELTGCNFSYPSPHNGTRDVHATIDVGHNIDARSSFWGYDSDNSARAPAVRHDMIYFSILTSSASSSPRAKSLSDRNSLSRDRMKSARALLVGGDPGSARTAFEEVLDDYGDLDEAAIAAVQGLVTTAGQLEQGASQYTALVELVQTDLTARVEQAVLYFAIDLLQHEQNFGKALSRMADFELEHPASELLPYLLLDKALLLEHRGEDEKALAQFQRLAAVYPDLPQAAKVREWLLARGETVPDTAAADTAKYQSGLSARTAPNPFNPSTTIRFHLPESGPVSLTLYNIAGQVVRRLLWNQAMTPGLHSLTWDGRDDQGRPAASGIYLYRLTAGRQAVAGKLTLLQ